MKGCQQASANMMIPILQAYLQLSANTYENPYCSDAACSWFAVPCFTYAEVSAEGQ